MPAIVIQHLNDIPAPSRTKCDAFWYIRTSWCTIAAL